MTKDQFHEVSSARSIDRIEFGTFSSNDVSKLSVVECVNHNFYSFLEKDRKPLLNGPLDTKLVFYQNYRLGREQCKKYMQYNCGKLLLNSQEKIKFVSRIPLKDNSVLKIKAHLKKFIAKSKQVRFCSYCLTLNGVQLYILLLGTVKKYNSIKIVYDAPQSANNSDLPPNTTACEPTKSKMKGASVSAVQRHKDYSLFGIFLPSSPINLILINVLVPPACIRPSVISDLRSGSNEDDLSIKLSEIIFKNNSISIDMKEGYRVESLYNNWDTLQMLICMYITGDAKGLPLSMMPKESIRSLVQRLKGKHGRFRGNLSGKRVDFSARTVISPDPNMSIDQVVVPVLMAITLTFPQHVNRYNIESLRQAVINGPEIHPGANFVISLDQTGRKFGEREIIAANLRPGDIVERHIADGDIVLFNRQPSLHRISIMAHKVKVMTSRTLRFNECVCTPYNADFDGDEMNIHVPQTQEARAEAYHLMGVKNNITTPRNGDPLISSIQDFITGSFILSSKNIFIGYNKFSSAVSSFLTGVDKNVAIGLIIPAILKPIVLWTGKQVISCMLNPTPSCLVNINIRAKGKEYTKEEELCHKDSLDKASIGPGSKNTIFYAILKQYGADLCAQIMLRLCRISTYFLTLYGFSIGIDDVKASLDLMKQMNILVDKGYSKCNEYIVDCQEKRLATQPGCTLEETLENFLPLVVHRFSKIPEAKGFVKNSFYTGLTPTEFYFHTMAGREGLVDTAVKTAETGYMQRRLVKCLEDLCVQYDNTIRNSSRQVVQFIYGGDGLDPIDMEGDEQPCQTYSFYDSLISSEEILSILNSYTSSLLNDINGVFIDKITQFVSKLSENCKNKQNYPSNDNITYVNVTSKMLNYFLQLCFRKYQKASIDPGTTVGAICAQSIGEPATQMTLKTFHFAGVAAMNITLGVPRLKEIINAAINISTPIISVPIDVNDDIDYARRVKGRIEKTTLGHVCTCISEIFSNEIYCIRIELDLNRIKLLQLEINIEMIVKAIVSSSILKLRPNQVVIMSESSILLYPQHKESKSKYFVFQQIKYHLHNLLIKGFQSVNRAIVHIDESNKSENPKYKLLVEGNDLRSVISTRSVVSTGVTCNSTLVVQKVLGVEAARQTIINEISYTMKNHGINVDIRHFILLADLMTYSGDVLGITRYGLTKMKEGASLMLASFEKTSEHLFDAAFHGSQDKLRGVSESIILGSPIGVGTGMFKILQKPLKPLRQIGPKNFSLFEKCYSAVTCK
ncbi:hypothetical protein MXB_3507 [Myxobolus squamalis]|nr:hypothetical protein MXB_3507 [Myxobolus squamalis]